MSSWVTAVPSPDPATPMPTPSTSTTDSTALSTAPDAATHSGVRVSSMPRSTPVAASTTSIPGSPGADQRR